LDTENDLKDPNIQVSFNLSYLIEVEALSPGTYSLKSCFEGTAIPTSFKIQSGRDNYNKVYVPGSTVKNPEVEKHYPGPAQYNMASKGG
jgi:hypothetical protein